VICRRKSSALISGVNWVRFGGAADEADPSAMMDNQKKKIRVLVT
jgi:hypothetical protein